MANIRVEQPVKFDEDGLLYDATYLCNNSTALPIAFGEKITESSEGSKWAFFTSSRGVRSAVNRGRAPRNWSVSMEMPWEYTVLVRNLDETQTAPYYLITPKARRNNFLPPWNSWSDVFYGVPKGSNAVRVNESDAPITEEAWKFGASMLRVFHAKDGLTTDLYGPKSGVIPGTTVRITAGLQGTGTFGAAPASARLVGLDIAENIVWTSPAVENAGSNFSMRTSEPFTIPDDKNIVALREHYGPTVVRFSPMQAWIGTHKPNQCARMGGWVLMDDVTYNEQPFAVSQLHACSFTLKEVL